MNNLTNANIYNTLIFILVPQIIYVYFLQRGKKVIKKKKIDN